MTEEELILAACALKPELPPDEVARKVRLALAARVAAGLPGAEAFTLTAKGAHAVEQNEPPSGTVQ